MRPGTQDEVAQVVAACAAAGAALVPWGGGTAMGLGNPPARVDVVVRLDRLDRVVEWDPANLCVTAEAGMRLAALQELIARNKTILPLDPPAGAKVTLGGLVAANLSGPRRLQLRNGPGLAAGDAGGAPGRRADPLRRPGHQERLRAMT